MARKSCPRGVVPLLRSDIHFLAIPSPCRSVPGLSMAVLSKDLRCCAVLSRAVAWLCDSSLAIAKLNPDSPFLGVAAPCFSQRFRCHQFCAFQLHAMPLLRRSRPGYALAAPIIAPPCRRAAGLGITVPLLRCSRLRLSMPLPRSSGPNQAKPLLCAGCHVIASSRLAAAPLGCPSLDLPCLCPDVRCRSVLCLRRAVIAYLSKAFATPCWARRCRAVPCSAVPWQFNARRILSLPCRCQA